MTDGKHELIKSIQAIVGSAHIEEHPPIRLDGLRPTLLVRPGSAGEVSACLKVCSEVEAPVVPAGEMTWLDCGNPLRRADVVLSLDRMRRIIDYSPADLTATVEAGLTLGEFNRVARDERQWLPLDPPGNRAASLGAIAACNASGALRLGFGTPRDYVIGLKLAHADGTESKSGGRVVKNVAGYDMNKLYVGSYGTLAVITELTFKLRPLPERSSTIAITSRSRKALFQLARALTAADLLPSSVLLARGLSARVREDLRGDALLVRFVDSDAAVEHQVAWVLGAASEDCQASLLNQDEAEAVWSDVADLDYGSMRIRLSLPLAAAVAEFEKVVTDRPDCAAAADVGTGIIRIGLDAGGSSLIRQLRSHAVSLGGSLIIERATTEVRREVDAWGDTGAIALMRTIKAKFDPRSILNPGKFVAGI